MNFEINNSEYLFNKFTKPKPVKFRLFFILRVIFPQ
jgi:hypothetical protein